MKERLENMSEIILVVIIGALAFVGIIGVISVLALSFYHVSGDTEEYIVLPVSGHMEDIEFRIRGTAVRRRRVSRHARIYLVNFGADAETAEIAKRMCREFEGLEWVEGTELTEKIMGNISAKNKK